MSVYARSALKNAFRATISRLLASLSAERNSAMRVASDQYL